MELLPRELRPPKLMQKDQFLPLSSLPPTFPSLVCVAQPSSGFGRIRHSPTRTQTKGRDENYEVPSPLNRKVSSKMPGDKPQGLLSTSCLDDTWESASQQPRTEGLHPHLIKQTEDQSLSAHPFLPSCLPFFSIRAHSQRYTFECAGLRPKIHRRGLPLPSQIPLKLTCWPRRLPLAVPGSVLSSY